MRDPRRIQKVLSMLAHYWPYEPDLRLGQIIGNIAGDGGVDPYHLEDDELLIGLEEAMIRVTRGEV